MVTGLPGQPDAVVPLPAAASGWVKLYNNTLHYAYLYTVPNVKKPRKERCSGTMAVSRSFHRQHRPQHSQPSRPLSVPTTSDSEVSDSEPQDSAISKALSCKLRHQALVCLASVFVVSHSFSHTPSPIATIFLDYCRLLVLATSSPIGCRSSLMAHACHTQPPPCSHAFSETQIIRQGSMSLRWHFDWWSVCLFTNYIYSCYSAGLQHWLCCVPCWKVPDLTSLQQTIASSHLVWPSHLFPPD